MCKYCPKLKENVTILSGVTLNFGVLCFNLCFFGKYIISNRLYMIKYHIKSKFTHQLVTNMKKKTNVQTFCMVAPAYPYFPQMFANTNKAYGSAKRSAISGMCRSG